MIDDLIIYYRDNPEKGLNLFYSSAQNYFKSLRQDIDSNQSTYEFQEDFTDFFPMEGDVNQYWVGFYTTHPNLKIKVRRFGFFHEA